VKERGIVVTGETGVVNVREVETRVEKHLKGDQEANISNSAQGKPKEKGGGEKYATGRG